MSNVDRKEFNKQAKRISRLRIKVEAGTATSMEQAEVASWERKHNSKAHPRKRKAPVASAPAGEPASNGASNVTTTVHSELPGAATAQTLPPLNVPPNASVPLGGGGTTSAPGAGTTSPSSSVPPPTPGHSAPHASTSGSGGPKIAMSPEEAKASGKMIADLATQILSEANKYVLAGGGMGISDSVLTMFHFSVGRMAAKYGAQIDEDTYDACVVVGSGAFVGYQSYLVYLDQETKSKTAAFRASPGTPPPNTRPAETVNHVKQPDPIPQQKPAPGNGLASVGSAVGQKSVMGEGPVF